MPTTPEAVFHYEVQKSEDEIGGAVTTIICHGRLLGENTSQIKELVKPLIPLGGRIVLDLTDLGYLDSSGLGALISLKVSAINQGFCILEFANMTPRVLELLRVTHLTKMFSS